jgi:hypothetical protein
MNHPLREYSNFIFIDYFGQIYQFGLRTEAPAKPVGQIANLAVVPATQSFD